MDSSYSKSPILFSILKYFNIFGLIIPNIVFILNQLQTSITRSFIKLECFLRPFLKTRSHDESAHTFKSSLRFLEVPQKGVLKKLFFAFFYHIFLHVWSYTDPLKLFQKSWELA